jgi:hypothetical protein
MLINYCDGCIKKERDHYYVLLRRRLLRSMTQLDQFENGLSPSSRVLSA